MMDESFINIVNLLERATDAIIVHMSYYMN